MDTYKINAQTIMKDAYVFTNEILKQELKEQGKGLSVSFLKTLHSPDVFCSEYGKTLIDNLILGAIFSYHEQLRIVFIEKGIDIGEMIPGEK